MCNSKFKPLAMGFHSHTDFSLDGGSTAKRKIKHIKEQGRPADCITDHGIMSGIADHHKAAKEEGIMSIHGIEAYVIDPDRPAKVYKNGKVEPQYYHLTIHFKDHIAYHHFSKLTPIMEERAVIKFNERKPLLKFEEIAEVAGHITVGSSCLVGPVQKNILNGRSDLAKKMYEYLRSTFGPENFYVEVFPHIIDHEWSKPVFDKESKKIIKQGGFKKITDLSRWPFDAVDIKPEPDPCNGAIDIQKGPNRYVMEMAKKYNDKVIISLDDHYGPKNDEAVQIMRLNNGIENWRFFGDYSSKSSDECAVILKAQLGVDDKTIEEWIDNGYEFIEHFKGYKFLTGKDRWLLPTIEMVYGDKYKGMTTKEIFWEIANRNGKLPKSDDPRHSQYIERINYELSVLCDNPVADFLPYFFLLQDVSEYAKQNDLIFGVRGSAGGSLVLYALDVSISDPIKYDLPFERFLTLGRIETGDLPDIDSDWPERSLINDYLMKKYGNQASLISSNMKMKLKSTILDSERSQLGYVRDETIDMVKKIPIAPSDNAEDFLHGKMVNGSREQGFLDDTNNPLAVQLKTYFEENKEINDTVSRALGITKTKGVHAGGIIITPGPVSDYMPVIKTKDEEGFVTAYDMKGAEMAGGVKYDFLSVETLKAISICLKSIKEKEGIDYKWDEMPHDDEVAEEIVFKNKLASVFQINTNSMLPYVTKIKPKNVREISGVIALVRPGALDAPSPDPKDPKTETAATYYMKCAQGMRKPYYIHEDLEPILGETFGICLYQEQTLEIYRQLAGYSYAEAEPVRRGIGKKIPEILEKHGQVLKERLLARGWSQNQADAIFEMIKASGRYSFNRSHSISYGIIAYNCCYLKHKHKLHYWKGFLTIWANDHEKLEPCLKECKDTLLSVDIIKSDSSEWLIEGDKLRPPMVMIKGSGEKGVHALRGFISKNNIKDDMKWDDFVSIIASKKKEGCESVAGLNLKSITTLIYVGAFDSIITKDLGLNSHNVYREMYDQIKKALKSSASLPKKTKTQTIGLDEVSDYVSLGMWRHQMNPLSEFDFSKSAERFMQSRFFNKYEHPVLPFKRNATHEFPIPRFYSKSWNFLFNPEIIKSDFFKMISNNRIEVCFIGVIKKSEIRTFKSKDGETKERMIVDVFNGYEVMDNLCIWPQKGQNEVSVVDKSMREGSMCILTVKPSLWNNKKSGTIIEWEEVLT